MKNTIDHQLPEENVTHWRSVSALAERLNQGSSKKTFSEHALRHYIRNSDTNGLNEEDCVRRLGRKILLHEQRFLCWLNRLKG